MADRIMESAVFHLNAIYPIRHPSSVNAVTIVPHPVFPFITVHNTIVTPQNITKETIRRYTLAPAKTSRIPRIRNSCISAYMKIVCTSRFFHKQVSSLKNQFRHQTLLLPLKVDSMLSYRICFLFQQHPVPI